jgi:hypothetical protein
MKQLILGIVLLTVVGLGGFLYRYTLEQPAPNFAQRACTEEARVCPDGASVGRSGPDCAFAVCPLPNLELAAAGIAFVIPPGYMQASTSDALAVLEKPTLSPSVKHRISVVRYATPPGQTADQVILAQTRFQPADEAAANFSRFTSVTLGAHTFRKASIERFEALVHSSYFLVRNGEVLRFDIVEHDVTDWMNPSLNERQLPEHQALERMLGSLQLRAES